MTADANQPCCATEPVHVADTTPYPWPYDGKLAPARLALVVTGWDEHWRAAVAPAGNETVAAAVANIVRLASAVDRTFTVSHPPLPQRGPVPAWAEPVPPVGVIPGAVTVAAAGVDGFYGGPLAALLRRAGVDQLLLAGFGLETTVHSTMRTANDAGLECLAVVDACVALDPGLTPRTVSMIEMSGGIFGAVGATGAVLDALTASCRCPAA